MGLRILQQRFHAITLRAILRYAWGLLLLIPMALGAQPQPADMYKFYLAESQKAFAARDYAKAERSLRVALDDATTGGGVSKEDVTRAYTLLADAYRWQRKYVPAQKTLNDLLATLQGVNDVKLAVLVSIKLARIDGILLQDTQVEEDLLHGINIVDAAGDEQQRLMLPLLDALAEHYQRTKQDGKTEPILKRAMLLTEQAQPVDLLALSSRAVALADCYRRQREFVQAIPLYHQTIERVQKQPPANPFPMVNALLGLAGAEDDQQKPTDARQHLQQAVAELEDFFGPDSPSLVRNFSRIAAAHQQAGRLTDADSLLQHTLQISVKVYGESEETKKVLIQYAGVLQQMGKVEDAGKHNARAKAIYAHR
ncbi:MAG: tetratricopeptide repeat protein [Armatimonadota bacterium]